MFMQRMMAMLGLAMVMTVLAGGEGLFAQAKKDDKKVEVKPKTDPKADPKKSGDDEIEDSWPKVTGKLAKIIKVDETKKTADVKMEGKNVTLTITDDTKFVGPRGGKREAFDDCFVAGRNIKVVMDGTKVKEVHLDTRPSEKKKEPKKDEKKEEKKKEEKKPA